MEKNLKQVNSSCIKIVLFGPESSGKTTLAKELSKSRTVTFALLVGIIIGYILGNIIPLDK